MKQGKKESILNTAKHMFGRYGIQKTSLDELSRVAKVAKATLYNYFGSKDQIYQEVLNREANDMLQKIIQVVEQAKSPIEKLKAYIDVKYHQMKDRANILNFPYESGMYQLLPRLINIRENLFNKEITIIQGILEQGIKEGVFCLQDVLQSARAIGYALRGFELTTLLDQNNLEIENDLDCLCALICNGIMTEKKGI